MIALCTGLMIVAIFKSTFVQSAPEIDQPGQNMQQPSEMAIATFAGGCFWCMEPPFEKLDGVSSVISGYIDGHKKNPTYKQVSSGTTGHTEAVQITYDPRKVSYEKLVDVFWHQIDPTDAGGSFVDRGKQYRSGIYYHNDTQKQLALNSKSAIGKSGLYSEKIATEIKPAVTFYVAEDYHQDYYKRNPIRYKFYRYNSGRDQYLEKIAKKEMALKKSIREKNMTTDNKTNLKNQSFVKPDKSALKKKLTSLQYEVTQEDGTERAFNNTYWDNHEEGIYVDIVSGEPLFSSKDKYESKTGWPSFIRPITTDALVEKEDRKLFSTRTELRSRIADSHLGHVFPDGPEPTGLRYCINSASLRFIPKEELVSQGYEGLAMLFK